MRPMCFTRWVAVWLVVMTTYPAQGIMGHSEWRAGWLRMDRLESETVLQFKDETCLKKKERKRRVQMYKSTQRITFDELMIKYLTLKHPDYVN